MIAPIALISIIAHVSSAIAAQDARTFAVMHFHGNGPLTAGRADPVVDPGMQSGHSHVIQGGNAFALTMDDTTATKATCTTANINNDKSNYWTPTMYFQHSNGSFESVDLYYMNVYYFFEPTDDTVVAFEPGFRMVSGNPTLRTAPATGADQLDYAAGPIQPVQFTCPGASNSMYPANSNGSQGLQDPGNAGAGAGFPDAQCNGAFSPLRADIHFPSCYNPAAGPDNYKTNSQFPSNVGTKQNCPAGWVHHPHLFYEVYWNTPKFNSLWTPGQGTQPFVLSNGDPTGYSLHGDFISGWDTATLNQIINNCNAGDAGMDQCPGIIGGTDLSSTCNMAIPKPAGAADEVINGMLAKLPGNNPVVGYGGTVVASANTSSNSSGSTTAVSSAANSSLKISSGSAKSTTPSTSATVAAIKAVVTSATSIASGISSSASAALTISSGSAKSATPSTSATVAATKAVVTSATSIASGALSSASAAYDESDCDEEDSTVTGAGFSIVANATSAAASDEADCEEDSAVSSDTQSSTPNAIIAAAVPATSSILNSSSSNMVRLESSTKASSSSTKSQTAATYVPQVQSSASHKALTSFGTVVFSILTYLIV